MSNNLLANLLREQQPEQQSPFRVVPVQDAVPPQPYKYDISRPYKDHTTGSVYVMVGGMRFHGSTPEEATGNAIRSLLLPGVSATVCIE